MEAAAAAGPKEVQVHWQSLMSDLNCLAEHGGAHFGSIDEGCDRAKAKYIAGQAKRSDLAAACYKSVFKP